MGLGALLLANTSFYPENTYAPQNNNFLFVT